MNAKLLTSSLATFALLVSSVAFGQAPATGDARPTILLEADSSALGKRGTGLDGIMLERLGPALEAEGIDTSGSITDLGVRVRVIPVDVGVFHYSILFEIEENGAYAQALGVVDCRPCIDATLLEKIGSRAPALADLIKERASEGEAPEGAGATQGGDESTTGDDDADDDEEEGGEDTDGGGGEPEPPIRRIGALGYVGIGTVTLGLGAVIGGAVELSRGLVIEAGADQQIQHIDHRRPGYVLVSVGATAVAVGAVLFGVDLGVRAQKRKRETHARKANVLPILTPDGVGVGVSGRF